MCGRFSLTDPAAAAQELFGVSDCPLPDPNPNVSPTDPVLAAGRSAAGEVRPAILRWGIPPRGSGDMLINARAETVAEKPTFRESFWRRRCVIAADAFYEWGMRNEEDGRRQAWRFADADGGHLAMAGLWQPMPKESDGAPEGSGACCVIITTEANPDVRDVHHRMPVLLPRSGLETWFDAEAEFEELEDLLGPAPMGVLGAERLENGPGARED